MYRTKIKEGKKMECKNCIHYQICGIKEYPFIKLCQEKCMFYNLDTSIKEGKDI
jgi:hypothetical protein